MNILNFILAINCWYNFKDVYYKYNLACHTKNIAGQFLEDKQNNNQNWVLNENNVMLYTETPHNPMTLWEKIWI